ncbi:site-specific DNA-methyltransferase [Leuconostoc lactis]
MFTYKEYWQDSYTKFENKMALLLAVSLLMRLLMLC